MTSSRSLFSQRAQARSQDGEGAGEVSPPLPDLNNFSLP